MSKKTDYAARQRVAARKWKLKSYYGISIEEYDQMMLDQNYSCAICSRAQSEFKNRFHVDHCHKTGKVRSLLCSNCNSSLGGFLDNPALLRRAATYIEEHS
jgi:hypothetical protein